MLNIERWRSMRPRCTVWSAVPTEIVRCTQSLTPPFNSLTCTSTVPRPPDRITSRPCGRTRAARCWARESELAVPKEADSLSPWAGAVRRQARPRNRVVMHRSGAVGRAADVRSVDVVAIGL